ncbi:polysaccharide biosynthesis protein [Fulvivirga sp. M361]|uniref:oligosaccharide flippase family protein n=1 Tax=Fulvivirga sp. M361 TaxID=2594266 RepID=UPI001179C449|nr:oligosaccharide flippase family protein [Fulvivirga sp. M361]TRX57788.1 polysaccharide biosynthesis protein [Fulvivirga sp. M361]
MGVITKGSLKYTTLQYAGVFISLINAIFLFPRFLTTEELGLVRLLFAFAFVLAHIAQFGGDNVIIRFHAQIRDNSTTLLIGAVFSTIGLLITSLILLTFKNQIITFYNSKSNLLGDYFYWLLLFIFSIIFYHLLDAFLSTLFKNTFTAFLKFILLKLFHLIAIVAYSYGYITFDTFIQVYICAQLIITFLALGYIIYIGQMPRLSKANFGYLTTTMSFSSFGLLTVLSKLSLILIERLDILMLGKFMELDSVAIYSVAFSLGTILVIPSEGISRIITVLIAKAFDKSNIEPARELYKKSALNQFFAGSLLFVLISINYPWLLTFLPTDYRQSENAFLFLGLAKVIYIGLGANGLIIVNSKYYRWDTYFSLLLLIMTMLTNYYFIPRLGITGAALATFLSFLAFSVVKLLFVYIKFRLSPFSRNYLKLFILILASYILHSFIPAFHSLFLDSIIKSIFTVMFFLGIAYFGKISPEINTFIQKAWSYCLGIRR